MAICENCSTNFTPSDSPTEVTSLRVLCQKCEAERKAERARRAAEKTATAAARPATASGTGAPPVPATKRVNPAASNAAAPVAAKAAAAPTPDAAPRMARPRAASAPAPVPAEPARRPASEPKKSSGNTPDVRREIAMLKQRENKVMMYGWIVCGVLVLIALGVWWRVEAKKSAEAAQVAAAAKEVDDFAAAMRAFDITNLIQANSAIALAEANKSKWEDSKITTEIGGIVGKARTNIDLAKERKELEERMVAVEDGIQNAASRPVEELPKIRRTLEDLENKADTIGPEFKTRVTAARAVIDRTYVVRLHDDAKALAAKGPTEARAALTAYTRAEDEVLKLFEVALRRKNKEAEEYYRTHFKAIIEESDTLATSLFTPEVIDKAPWKDLLSGDQTKNWANDGLKGFRIVDGVLQATGPEVGAGKIGIMSIGDREQWRDFELDIEFTLVSGNGHFFFRLGKRADNTVESYPIAPGEGGVKLGEKYSAKATFIGSKLSITWGTSDIAPFELPTIWSRSRKGAFGVTLTEGSAVTFTRLRVRELR